MNDKVETWLCGIMFTIGMGVLPIFFGVVVILRVDNISNMVV